MLGGLRTSSGLHFFWEIVDGILNVVLFTMVGFEVLVIPFTGRVLGAGLLAIPVVLLARLAVVGGKAGPFARRLSLPPRSIAILTWGRAAAWRSRSRCRSARRSRPRRSSWR